MSRQYSLKSISLLLIVALPLYANIDAQIDAIRNAPVSERFKLMNAFKKEVIHMHKKERIMAISKLSSMTSSKHGSRVLDELQGKDQKGKDQISNIDKETVKPMVEIKNEREGHILDATEDHIEDEIEDKHEDDD